jgi:hypothetical protein
MRVLPNRAVRAREAWRAMLHARADAHRPACRRCRACGFVAYRALERCPACGRWNGPFEPVRRTRDDAHAAPVAQRFDTWPSRVARALRNTAFRQPHASSAPILSILTLVLLVGGYVMVDRRCKADPVCRGSNVSGATPVEAGPHASNDPVPPVLPASVHPSHSPDGSQMAKARSSSPAVGEPAGRMVVAQIAPSIHAPDRARADTVRLADWKGNRHSAHRSHVRHRASMHTRHARRGGAVSHADIAKLYRSH